ncbi:hypothetical protein [Flavobacterium sp. JP2137]|uniref:hypothetical protein n=1 Tax=Flavobacterium sp. JP2137 TaxID=3414510 RepID=UPI003D2FD78E
MIDPTGRSAEGWRTVNETGKREYNKSFTRENTPSTHTYDDAILDGKNQLFYDESGEITSTGTVMENISITKASSTHPCFSATLFGEYGPSSMKFESNNPYVNGAMNSTRGAAAGGAIALTMSLGKIGIGIGQIAETASGGNNQNLQLSSNIPGLAH